MFVGEYSCVCQKQGADTRPTGSELYRAAFTIVELLVVVAILGVLVALLLPAIQAARESSRRTTCQNHLKQIGLAVHHHLSAHGHFPTGGWGSIWTGDPDRGFGRNQPGGWVYNLLPYLEQQDLHALGAGLPEAEKRQAAARRMETVLPLLNCPTRRAAVRYPVESFRYRNRMVNADVPRYVTRSDYAINVGHRGTIAFLTGGPASQLEAETTFAWPDPKDYSGLSFARSEVRAGQVTSGMAKTLMVGEKYLNPEFYDTGSDPSDWGHAFGGLSEDVFRLAGVRFHLMRDSHGVSRLSIFGSAHSHCHFVLCDGSVQAIDYDIDPAVYEMLAKRHDGD